MKTENVLKSVIENTAATLDYTLKSIAYIKVSLSSRKLRLQIL